MNIQLPQEFPVVLLVTSGLFYAQRRARQKLLEKQAKIMGKESFMSDFQQQHNIAFDGLGPKKNEMNPIYKDGGQPLQGQYGWYSTRLSYKEWYSIACARKAYDEITEESTRVTFQLLTGSLMHPMLSICFGTLYLYAT